MCMIETLNLYNMNGGGSGGWKEHQSVHLATRGPMTPYTPLNIANIHNINLIPATPLNMFSLLLISEFLLPPLISANPYYPLLIPTAPHNINYFRQPPPNIQYSTTPIHPG